MKVTVVYSDIQFSQPISYTFDTMLSILGVEYEIIPYCYLSSDGVKNGNLLISYGRNRISTKADRQIHIYQSKMFGRDYKTLCSMPRLPLKRWKELPIIYEGSGDIGYLVVRCENIIETNIDIIASSFFMLSRYEEILIDTQDQYSRFPATASIAYKEDFLTRPIVNEYIDLLWEWINSLNLGFRRKKLWNGKAFALCLTHDIDILRKYRWYNEIRTFGAMLIKHREPIKVLSHVSDSFPRLLRLKPDPYWNFDYLMELYRVYGFKCSFYFMSCRSRIFDDQYNIQRHRVVKLIREIERSGHEIGLHGSLSSYNNPKMLADEKKKLDSIVSIKQYGGRQHALRWKTPDTWRILEAAGLVYDTTLGFADYEGYRCGFCFPYRPFDVIENRTLDIWELPLTVMDCTLLKYRGMSLEEAWPSIQSLLEVVRKYNGLFVLLWHNSFLDDLDLPGWRKLYERLIGYVASLDIFCASGIEILGEWRST